MPRMTQRISHGTQALNTSLPLGSFASGTGTGLPSAEVSLVPHSLVEVQISLGCHTRRNRIKQAMAQPPAAMSTIQGLMKLEIRNCGTAKLTPATTMAGHTSHIFRQPTSANTSQKGMSRAKKDDWRPTIWPRMNGS